MLGVGPISYFGSALLSINSGALGNGLVIGSGYNVPLVPGLINPLGLFVMGTPCDHVSRPVLVSKSIIFGTSPITMGFISFLDFPENFTPLHVSGAFVFFALR